MIADPHDGPRTCSRCERAGRCPTPQACEQAVEEERQGQRALRHVALAAVAIAAILLILYWRSK
jgi:predicted nucleic acid-binding Zn ribbon protein